MPIPHRLTLVLACSALALGACATTATTPAEKAGLRPPVQAAVAPPADPPIDGESVYGLFLAGNAAANEGRSADAARYFAQAARADESAAGLIRERAFIAALMAGDITIAASVAPSTEEGSVSSYRTGRLTKAVEAMALGDAVQARGLLTDGEIGAPHGATAALLTPWAAALAGDVPASTTLPEITGNPLAEPFAKFGRALLLERAKRYREADEAYRALIGELKGVSFFNLGYGEFLERRGRRADALRFYDGVLKDDPADNIIIEARARVQARGKAPPLPTPQQAAAQTLMVMAANLISQRQPEMGAIYLRLALRLDPTRNEAWVMIGDFLEQGGDVEGARAALAKVAPDAPEYMAARVRLAVSYDRAGEVDEAIAIVQEAARGAPQNLEIQTLLADLLSSKKDYAGVIQVLDRVIAAKGASAEWRQYFSRGVAYERTGRWVEAERDLMKAYELAPTQPDILNYLGYSWVDRGERLNEALGMLQRAVRAQPNSGAVIDSLGWAYYRLGDYQQARENLEQAVQLEAGDPDVNDHLGDVYWRLGREREARFQWSRVLTLEPDDRLKAKVENKLRVGLEDGPPAVARPAGA